MIHDEEYDSKFCIHNDCFCHTTQRKSHLREFRSLKGGVSVKFGNNEIAIPKGYEMITNGEVTIWKVAYVERLKHNIISVSQIVVSTCLKVSFDERSLEI